MDAVPVTLGQEFAGYAAQVRLGTQRVKATLPRLGMIPLGGTATGTGLNTHPKFAKMVREIMAKETNLKISAPADPFEAQANRDGLVEASAALKMVAVSLTKMGNFELNVRIPLMARNLLQSVALLTSTATVFRTKCVDGIEPNLEGLLGHAEGTLAAATALNPYIGYDLATDIVKDATASGRSLREVAREKGVDEATLNKALNLKKIAKGGII
jgi:fumarate hydratase class II